MRTCTVLATGRILEAQSGDSADFAALLVNAAAAGYGPDAVICEVRPDAAAIAALRLQESLDTVLGQLPSPSEVITRAEFKKRISMAYIRMGQASESVQRKWDRILNGLLSDYDEVRTTDPVLRALVSQAVSDDLLTEAEGTAALA